MNIRNLKKKPFYLLIIVAIMVTSYVGLMANILGMTLFAVLPYFVMLYLLWVARHYSAVFTAKIVTLFIVMVGLYFLLDTTYMERQLGDKFSFYFMPIWQLTMLLFTGLVIVLGNGSTSEESL